MTALTKDRNTKQRDGDLIAVPAVTNKKFYAGAIACINASGWATPGATATTLKAVGCVEAYLDTTGLSSGAVSVLVRRGVFKLENASDIVQADTFGTAYIVDDQTVAGDDGTGTRSVAGKIIALDDDGVWVEFT
jgi:hypothetical protein